MLVDEANLIHLTTIWLPNGQVAEGDDKNCSKKKHTKMARVVWCWIIFVPDPIMPNNTN